MRKFVLFPKHRFWQWSQSSSSVRNDSMVSRFMVSGLCNEDHGPKTLETRHARRWMKIGVLENFQSRAAVRWTLVLRSRRGWGGGRAHGRAPPLPKGTYISWLAVGITRSYNTIASASSATKHASSREYSSLFLLHRSVSHIHGVSLFLGNNRVVLVAW